MIQEHANDDAGIHHRRHRFGIMCRPARELHYALLEPRGLQDSLVAIVADSGGNIFVVGGIAGFGIRVTKTDQQGKRNRVDGFRKRVFGHMALH